MKSFLIISILLISNFISFSNETELSKEELQLKLEKAAATMVVEAKKAEIQGAVVVAFVRNENGGEWDSVVRTVGNWIEPPKKEGGKGANLVAIAYAKAAEVMRTKKNSGASGAKPFVGENGWMGAGVKQYKDGYIIAAFSGGPSKVDLEVSMKGIAAFIESDE